MAAKRPRSEKERRFYDAWKSAAREALCDASNGAEFRRVFSLWREDGCPARVRLFIIRHANAPSRRKA